MVHAGSESIILSKLGPAGRQNIVDYINRGGTVYASGKSAVLLENMGAITAGTVNTGNLWQCVMVMMTMMVMGWCCWYWCWWGGDGDNGDDDGDGSDVMMMPVPSAALVAAKLNTVYAKCTHNGSAADWVFNVLCSNLLLDKYGRYIFHPSASADHHHPYHLLSYQPPIITHHYHHHASGLPMCCCRRTLSTPPLIHLFVHWFGWMPHNLSCSVEILALAYLYPGQMMWVLVIIAVDHSDDGDSGRKWWWWFGGDDNDDGDSDWVFEVLICYHEQHPMMMHKSLGRGQIILNLCHSAFSKPDYYPYLYNALFLAMTKQPVYTKKVGVTIVGTDGVARYDYAHQSSSITYHHRNQSYHYIITPSATGNYQFQHWKLTYWSTSIWVSTTCLISQWNPLHLLAGTLITHNPYLTHHHHHPPHIMCDCRVPSGLLVEGTSATCHTQQNAIPLSTSTNIHAHHRSLSISITIIAHYNHPWLFPSFNTYLVCNSSGDLSSLSPLQFRVVLRILDPKVTQAGSNILLFYLDVLYRGYEDGFKSFQLFGTTNQHHYYHRHQHRHNCHVITIVTVNRHQSP